MIIELMSNFIFLKGLGRILNNDFSKFNNHISKSIENDQAKVCEILGIYLLILLYPSTMYFYFFV